MCFEDFDDFAFLDDEHVMVPVPKNYGSNDGRQVVWVYRLSREGAERSEQSEDSTSSPTSITFGLPELVGTASYRITRLECIPPSPTFMSANDRAIFVRDPTAGSAVLLITVSIFEEFREHVLIFALRTHTILDLLAQRRQDPASHLGHFSWSAWSAGSKARILLNERYRVMGTRIMFEEIDPDSLDEYALGFDLTVYDFDIANSIVENLSVAPNGMPPTFSDVTTVTSETSLPHDMVWEELQMKTTLPYRQVRGSMEEEPIFCITYLGDDYVVVMNRGTRVMYSL